MNTPDDDQIHKREKAIAATRDAFPCNTYGAMSTSILLCDICGHDEEAHIDKAHDEALELDDERDAVRARNKHRRENCFCHISPPCSNCEQIEEE